ncbi:MAG TPA: DUF302 domain-containing protein [Armatimonadota bacterium]|jgi:uncharacterized protein (DUF302 family)
MEPLEAAYGKMGITTSVVDSIENTSSRVKAALKEEGFGVLTEINVAQTLKDKLGVDFRPYVILGACNPSLAYRSLTTNPAMGLMLPCNVVIEQREGMCIVSAMDPEAGIAAFGAEELKPVADEAKERLTRVIAAVAGH